MSSTKKIKATNINAKNQVNSRDIIKEGDCIFPFIYKGKIINECQKGKNGDWCATELDERKNWKKIGYCNNKKKSSKKKN